MSRGAGFRFTTDTGSHLPKRQIIDLLEDYACPPIPHLANRLNAYSLPI